MMAFASGFASLVMGCDDDGVDPIVTPPDTTPPDTTPPDTTPPDTTPPDTRNCQLPDTGVCVENDYHYCDRSADEERVIHCEDEFEGGVCGRIGPHHPVMQCLVPIGESCVRTGEDGTYVARCEGADTACAGFFADDAVCVAGVGTCSVANVSSCFGDHYVAGCINGQPRTWDCAALGGICGDEACIDLPEGAVCHDGKNTIARLRCADGLRCEQPSGAASGVCAPE